MEEEEEEMRGQGRVKRVESEGVSGVVSGEMVEEISSSKKQQWRLLRWEKTLQEERRRRRGRRWRWRRPERGKKWRRVRPERLRDYSSWYGKANPNI